MTDLLPLDSPLWNDLDACYSIEAAVSALREIVATRRLGEPWDQLTSELYHQGSVYGAADAVIPHLIAVAPHLTPAERATLFVDIAFWTVGDAALDPDAEPAALATLLSAPADSYLTLACVALAGHPVGAALEAFLSPGEGYVTLLCPACDTEYEVDGFGDPLSPPNPPPPLPTVDPRNAPAWTDLANALSAAGNVLSPAVAVSRTTAAAPESAARGAAAVGPESAAEPGPAGSGMAAAGLETGGPGVTAPEPEAAGSEVAAAGVEADGWDDYVRVAVAVARAGLPEDTPNAAVWCLVAAVVAMRGDAAWGRTLARLTGTFHCTECDRSWPIADLLTEDGEADEDTDSPISADANGFRSPAAGPPPSAWTLPIRPLPNHTFPGVPATALTTTTAPDARPVLVAIGGPSGAPRRWYLDTAEPLPPATPTHDALTALTATTLPDGTPVLLCAGTAAHLHRWNTLTGALLPPPTTSPDAKATTPPDRSTPTDASTPTRSTTDASASTSGATSGRAVDSLSSRAGDRKATVVGLAIVGMPEPILRHEADPPWLAELRGAGTPGISGASDGGVWLWDPTTGAALGELFRTEGAVRGLTLAGEHDVVVVSGERTVDVWSGAAVTGERSYPHGGRYVLRVKPGRGPRARGAMMRQWTAQPLRSKPASTAFARLSTT